MQEFSGGVICGDMYKRDRVRNINRSAAKLTIELVREIRKLYAASGCTYKELGEKYGVGINSIARVVANQTWVE